MIFTCTYYRHFKILITKIYIINRFVQLGKMKKAVDKEEKGSANLSSVWESLLFELVTHSSRLVAGTPCRLQSGVYLYL